MINSTLEERYSFAKKFQRIGLSLIVLGAIGICVMNFKHIAFEVTDQQYKKYYMAVQGLDCYPDNLIEILNDGRITQFEYFTTKISSSFKTKKAINKMILTEFQPKPRLISLSSKCQAEREVTHE